MDLSRLSLVECADAIARGDVSASEVTQAALARIDLLDTAIGAMVYVDRDGALRAARAIDAMRVRCEELPPLAGVPLTIKDLISVEGMPLTAGSRILSGYTPPFEATVTRRLRAAGAVILGKANLDEFAMGSSGERSVHGPTRNPWAQDRVAGGSSSGSAAAVAMRFGCASLGTDTGGSIRLPAALCGVVGIKPTYGRVSRHGVVAFASSLDQVGPIARTVRDTARLLKVIAGPCTRDATCSPLDVPDFEAALTGSVRGLRIGIPRPFLEDADGLDPEVATRVHEAIVTLSDLGADTVPVDLPHTRYAIATYYLVATAEASANLARYDGVRYGHRAQVGPDDSLAALYARARGEGFGREVKRRIILGTFALSTGYYDAYYDRACRVRRLIHDDYVSALTTCDALIGPTSPVPAWKLGERLGDPLAMYLVDVFTTGASLAGLPAMSIPARPTQAGLPVGVQLIGRHADEATLLRIGDVLTRALGTDSPTVPDSPVTLDPPVIPDSEAAR